MRAIKLFAACGIAALLAACGTLRPASVGEGACELAQAPEHQILGKTEHDQAWIDDTTEGLVAGCSQPRPKARPAEWDAPPAPIDASGNKAKRRTIRDLIHQYVR